MAIKGKKAGGSDLAGQLNKGYDLSRLAMLDKDMVSERDARAIASLLADTAYSGKVLELLESLETQGKTYDWNVALIMRHLNVGVVSAAIEHVDNPASLMESSGFAWALRYLRTSDHVIVNFLHRVVQESANYDARWNAAHSLERLEEVDAVALLRQSIHLERNLDKCLRTLESKQSVLSVLAFADQKSMARISKAVRKGLFGGQMRVRSHAAWLAGRLGMQYRDIVRGASVLANKGDYEAKYNAWYALRSAATERDAGVFVSGLRSSDATTRRLAARTVREIGMPLLLPVIEECLEKESDPHVAFELGKTFYRVTNEFQKARVKTRRDLPFSENGCVFSAEKDAESFDRFLDAYDVEGLAFRMLRRKLGNKTFRNVVCADAGNGRSILQVLNSISTDGVIYGTEDSKEMRGLLSRRLADKRISADTISADWTSLSDLKNVGVRSDLIIKAYSLPGHGFDLKALLKELRVAHSVLNNGGLYCTIGWDERKPDGCIKTWSRTANVVGERSRVDDWFERCARSVQGKSSAGLTWWKQGVYGALQFTSMRDAALTLGRLFGREAGQAMIRDRRLEKELSLGITCDTKESLGRAIKEIEAELKEAE